MSLLLEAFVLILHLWIIAQLLVVLLSRLLLYVSDIVLNRHLLPLGHIDLPPYIEIGLPRYATRVLKPDHSQ